ncbi:hypothetical protein ACP275_04G216500 [Erythranthe tilingii]
MAMASLFRFLLLLHVISSGSFQIALGIGIGINYGQLANNLPPPSDVLSLLKTLKVTRVKLYNPDSDTLTAFANTGIEFMVGVRNEDLQRISDPTQAQLWVQQNIRPHTPQTKITSISVGNEILGSSNNQYAPFLLPAMQAISGALTNLGLSDDIYVTSAHSYVILENSYPPSSGSFKQNLVGYIKGILDFHSRTNSSFLINAYPFFAYKDNPTQIPLNYSIFEPSKGTTDNVTNLHYDNMLYAQIDAVYSAMKLLGHTDVRVRVSETGWPSKGEPDEVGATPENARLYNGNLLKRMEKDRGTPANPDKPIDIYIFALFNENLKPGPVSERNYGLLYPNGTPVYEIGLRDSGSHGYVLPQMEYSSSTKNVMFFSNMFLLLLMCSL